MKTVSITLGKKKISVDPTRVPFPSFNITLAQPDDGAPEIKTLKVEDIEVL